MFQLPTNAKSSLTVEKVPPNPVLFPHDTHHLICTPFNQTTEEKENRFALLIYSYLNKESNYTFRKNTNEYIVWGWGCSSVGGTFACCA